MKLKALDISLSDSELMRAITQMLEGNADKLPPEARGKVKNLTIDFAPGRARVKGSLMMGFVPMPFEAHIEPSFCADGLMLALRLAKVKAAFFSGDGSTILSALAEQLPASPDVAIEGDTMLLHVTALFAKRGINIDGRLTALNVGEGVINLVIG